MTPHASPGGQCHPARCRESQRLPRLPSETIETVHGRRRVHVLVLRRADPGCQPAKFVVQGQVDFEVLGQTVRDRWQIDDLLENPAKPSLHEADVDFLIERRLSDEPEVDNGQRSPEQLRRADCPVGHARPS